jgi:hypothetical protein
MSNRAKNKKKVEEKAINEISPKIEEKFKLGLHIMSWIVGLSFIAIIILCTFKIPTLDILVKMLFYLGIINLLLFAVVELFGASIKHFLNKLI